MKEKKIYKFFDIKRQIIPKNYIEKVSCLIYNKYKENISLILTQSRCYIYGQFHLDLLRNKAYFTNKK